MDNGFQSEDFGNDEIIRPDDDFEGSKQLILGEEKGLFKPEDTFWVDSFIIREWNIRNSNSFQMEIISDSGAVHEVRGVSGSKKGGYITTTTKTLNKLGLKVGTLVFVRPINS